MAESHILKDKRVRAVATFIGSGPPRFYLPVSPEKPYASYAQLIVEVDDYRSIADLIPEFSAWFRQQMPQAIAQARPFGVGPGETWKLVLRVIGPWNARLPDELVGGSREGGCAPTGCYPSGEKRTRDERRVGLVMFDLHS